MFTCTLKEFNSAEYLKTSFRGFVRSTDLSFGQSGIMAAKLPEPFWLDISLLDFLATMVVLGFVFNAKLLVVLVS